MIIFIQTALNHDKPEHAHTQITHSSCMQLQSTAKYKRIGGIEQEDGASSQTEMEGWENKKKKSIFIVEEKIEDSLWYHAWWPDRI